MSKHKVSVKRASFCGNHIGKHTSAILEIAVNYPYLLHMIRSAVNLKALKKNGQATLMGTD